MTNYKSKLNYKYMCKS